MGFDAFEPLESPILAETRLSDDGPSTSIHQHFGRPQPPVPDMKPRLRRRLRLRKAKFRACSLSPIAEERDPNAPPPTPPPTTSPKGSSTPLCAVDPIKLFIVFRGRCRSNASLGQMVEYVVVED